MRKERIAVTMPHSTAKAFRRYGQIHDIDLCVAAKTAVTEYCRQTPPQRELMVHRPVRQRMERVFISMPDTAMRLLELWSKDSGIPRQELMEWAIRKLASDDEEEEEE